MKKISTPTRRAYYPASPNEPWRVLCWLPPEELAQMAERGQAPAGLLDDHPDGLEVEVTEGDLAEVGITLPVEAEALRQAYLDLVAQGQVPASGMVDGRTLEGMVLGPSIASFSLGTALPEPEMSDGEDAGTLLKGLG